MVEDFIVDCYPEKNCGGRAMFAVTNRECCVDYSDSVSFRIEGSESCLTCVGMFTINE